jgi:hypothetical protein
VLTVLAVAIWLGESRTPREGAGQTAARGLALFGFDPEQLGSIEAIYEGRSSALVRDEQGGWYRHGSGHRHGESGPGDHGHASDPEEAAEILRQIEATARARADRRVSPSERLEAYGLRAPAVMLAFYGRREDRPDYARPLEVLYVGDLLPDRFAYYALREGEEDLLVVPRYQVALLLAALFGPQAAPSPTPREEAAAGSR